jgi:hypothetical protein
MFRKLTEGIIFNLTRNYGNKSSDHQDVKKVTFELKKQAGRIRTPLAKECSKSPWCLREAAFRLLSKAKGGS